MWHFLFCRLAEFTWCQAWTLSSYEERSLQDLLCRIDPGLFEWLIRAERCRYASLRTKKDLCALIKTFVLLQTAVIVWVSVGSSSFIHRCCCSRISLKKKQGPPGPDVKLSRCSHRNRQKARMIITIFSCSALSDIFWCKSWRWRGDHTWTQKKEQAQDE